METRVTRDDGTLVLEGTAVCYTMPLPPTMNPAQSSP
jgi:hypothetical protein